ncbi:hypothetical protein AB0K24_44190, partial [Streptomyces mirabilis]
VDADVIGYTGPQTRPRALAVRLANGRTALTQTLSAPLAAQIAQVLVTPVQQNTAAQTPVRPTSGFLLASPSWKSSRAPPATPSSPRYACDERR